MGAKSSAPPPDPRLAAANIESLQQQTEIARRQMSLQEQMQPMQQEALRFGLESSRVAYGQAQEDRAYALQKRDRLDAAQKPLLDEALNFNESTRRAELMGQTDAEISRNFAEAEGQQQRGLTRTGVTVTDEQQAAMKSQAGMAEAKARSYAGNAVSTAAKSEGINARANAVNMLSGYGPMASGLATTGAQIGSSATNIVNAGAKGVTGGLSAAGQIFGQMGKQASSLWNEQAQAKFASDKAASDSNAETWGTVISVVAMVAMSDRRLKKNIQRIGRTARGVPMYRFQYLGGDTYYEGPMADEVEQLVPHAVRDIGGYKAVDYSLI
jgi:hypothetical protein